MQRSLCDDRDGGFPWTKLLHQILFQVRENCYWILWNAEDSFSGTKTQSSEWKSPRSPRPKKTRQVKKPLQVNVDLFLWQKGIVHKEFVPPGQAVNAAFYVEVLKRLRENVRRKRPDQWRNNTWLLHHDNVPAHAALLPRRFLTDNNMTVVPHPPYSPDLAHSDFFLISIIENEAYVAKISDFGGKLSRVAGRPEHATRKRFPRMLQKLAAPLGSLSSLRMGLFWRWSWHQMSNVSLSVF